LKSRPTRHKTPGERFPEAGPTGKKIFILEANPLFRENLTRVLNQEKDLAVIGAASTADDVLKAIPLLAPDLVLADISLAGNGPQFVKDLRAMNRNMKVLIISANAKPSQADRLLRAGADGYILKHEDPDEVAVAIHDVLAGQIYVSEEVLTRPKRTSKGPTDS
jgi:DNA-binding NarL/FixJ family response regulator